MQLNLSKMDAEKTERSVHIVEVTMVMSLSVIVLSN